MNTPDQTGRSEVIVLCWNKPDVCDRRAQTIAAFMGADAKFVALGYDNLSTDSALRKAVPKCICLIVQAETLTRAAEATHNGVSGLRSLLHSAEHTLIYGWNPTDRHSTILQHLSSDALVRVTRVPHRDGRVDVAADRRWCGQFSGLSLAQPDHQPDCCFFEGTAPKQHTVLIRVFGKSFLVRTEDDDSQLFFLADGELADLDEQLSRDTRLVSFFSRLAPLMMFLRGSLGGRVWHNDNPQACFIIDDPLLKRRYGFLEYGRLMAVMDEHRFSTSVAFIPWNYRRSSISVARLFSSSGRASLCVHGCDHTRGEFASSNLESLHRKARLARKRMQIHHDLSGVPFDDIMVFPQGLFSNEAMMALKTSGFLAAVNTSVCPSTTPETFTLRDLLEVAVTRFGDFPLFGRHYPNDVAEFAFDLFLGKPALAVEHHSYFRNGYQALQTFVMQLNALDERLEWTNLASICSRACLTRTTDTGDVHVRFYTDRFVLTNSGTQPLRCVLFHKHTSDEGLPAVSVDGSTWPCECHDEYLKFHLSLMAGQTVNIRVLSNHFAAEGFASNERSTFLTKVPLRRLLSEFRDNHVDTDPVLSRIASTVRNRHREQH